MGLNKTLACKMQQGSRLTSTEQRYVRRLDKIRENESLLAQFETQFSEMINDDTSGEDHVPTDDRGGASSGTHDLGQAERDDGEAQSRVVDPDEPDGIVLRL